MSRSRLRRWPLLLLVLIVLPALVACEMPGTGSTTGTQTAPSESQPDLTRKIEEKAAAIERRAQEIQTMQGTDQEKIDAVADLDRERRELQEMIDSGGEAR